MKRRAIIKHVIISFRNTGHDSLNRCVSRMISNRLNDMRLVCFTKYVLGFNEDRRMGLSAYENTFSRERSPDLDATRGRWNTRAGSIARSLAILAAGLFPRLFAVLSFLLNL
ncbi:hypothetical protein DPMN_049886 [Dreissena polymorpha]|uniref:Uncharacterized protein n=1 Tax=Dreissena polymorpha TaxID=45954 RepID=A0A9D4CF44_DREPO|nr:hypothetical protein DPMN_049886 [Dreissena polymorpha]